MTTLKITGYRQTHDAVRAAKLVREIGSCDLLRAKQVIKDVLNGMVITLTTPLVQKLCRKLRDCGFECEVMPMNPYGSTNRSSLFQTPTIEDLLKVANEMRASMPADEVMIIAVPRGSNVYAVTPDCKFITLRDAKEVDRSGRTIDGREVKGAPQWTTA